MNEIVMDGNHKNSSTDYHTFKFHHIYLLWQN